MTDYKLKLKRPANNFRGIEHNYWVYHEGAPLKEWFIETNSLGWREVATHDLENTGSKLMLLGDSVTYGWGVDETSTLSLFLFQELAGSKTTKNWSVLNRSAPGWHTYDQLLYWRSQATTNTPDVVVINVVMNDFKPETDATIDAKRSNLEKGSLFSKRSRFFRLTEEWLMFLIRKRSLNIDPTRKTTTPDIDLGKYKKDKLWYIRGKFNSAEKKQLYAKASQLTYRRLEQLSRSITESGSIPVFAIFPASAQVSQHYWARENYAPVVLEGRAIAELTSWMRDKKFRFLNLLPAFRQSEEYPLFIDSFHLSPEGNRVAANEIFQYLQKSGHLE